MAFVQFKKGGNKHFGPRDVREVKAGETVQLADHLLGRYGDALDIVEEGTPDNIDDGATSETEDFNAKKAAKKAERDAVKAAAKKTESDAISNAKADKKASAAKKNASNKKAAAKG